MNYKNKKNFLISDYGDLALQYMKGIAIMHAPHIHSSYELYFCPDNITQRSVICGIEYEHRYPSAIIARPYTIHSMSCLEDCETDYTSYVFYFSEGLISTLGKKCFPSLLTEGKMGLLFRLTPDEAEELRSLIEVTKLRDGNISLTERKLSFTLIINRLFNFCQNGRITEVGESSYYVQEVLKYIAEHFNEKIDCSRLAEKFSVSRSKLDRDFKAAIGATAQVFIEDCRLNNAKRLLVDYPDFGAEKIAELCGFSTENYFYRFFKIHTGLTPGEYRKSKLSKKER